MVVTAWNDIVSRRQWRQGEYVVLIETNGRNNASGVYVRSEEKEGRLEKLSACLCVEALQSRYLTVRGCI